MGATNPNAGGAPGGGGKGGMGMNRGPGGNAQNNPGGGQQGPGQNYNMTWGGRPAMSNDSGYGNFGGNPINASSPTAYTGNINQGPQQTIQDLVRMEQGFGGQGRPGYGGHIGTPLNASTWGSRNPAGRPDWASTQGLTPMGQPAQFAAQRKAINNPAPSPQQGILDVRNRMLYGR